jgi:hypothetical protein
MLPLVIHDERREGRARDVLHDVDGTFADERDRHGMGAHGVARRPGTAWDALNKAKESCGSGSCGVPRPSLADYVMGTGTPRGAAAAGGA